VSDPGLLPVTLNTFIGAARQKNRDVTLQPGTVVAVTGAGDVADVQLDGSSTVSVIPYLSGLPSIAAEARVMVLFYPPQGALIIGTIRGPTMWQRQLWTPTFAGGWVQGNGTFDISEYYDLGTLWFLRVHFTRGSTTTVGGALRIELPEPPSSVFTINEDRLNRSAFGEISDISAGQSWRGFWRPVISNTFIEFRPHSAPSTTQIGTGGQVTSTVPFTWATGDTWMLEGFIIKK
jgi:hypothetical protein